MLIDAVKTHTNVPPAQTINDNSSAITYNGAGWAHHRARTFGDLSGDVHATKTNGESATFTFYGTGIDVISEKNSDLGDLVISIDGGAPQTVSAYAGSRSAQQTVYAKRGLTSGPHTITITKQSGEYMLLDGFTTYN